MKKPTRKSDLRYCRPAPMTTVLRLTPADINQLIDAIDYAPESKNLNRIRNSIIAQMGSK